MNPITKKIRLHFISVCCLFFMFNNVHAQADLNRLLYSIQLTVPFNEQRIEVNYPLFSWSSNIDFSKGDITYTFKIVEVFSFQTAQNAILSNPSLFEKEVGNVTILQYPIDAPELQDCKIYAWQVVAYSKKDKIVDEKSYKVNYTNKIAQSEPYLFTTKCNQQARISNPTSQEPYIILAKTVDNFVFRLLSDQLNFKYVEEYAAYELKYTIYNWKREVLLTNNPLITSTKVPLDYGWNYLSIDLTNASPALIPNSTPSDNNIYQLEVETPKGDIYKAKFEITQ